MYWLSERLCALFGHKVILMTVTDDDDKYNSENI